MTVSISGTGGVTFPDNSVQTTAATGFGFKSRIINGACVIDQRNAGASVTFTNTVGYSLDRYRAVAIGTSLGFSVQKSSIAPSGFANSLLATVTTAKVVASSDQTRIDQFVEGFNVADLGWGTASAATVTVSFWVRSSVTGTYCVEIGNSTSPSRSYLAEYTISSANTFEYKTIVIAGDTTGTWATGNSVGVALSFVLGMGSAFNGSTGWQAGEKFQTTNQTQWIANSGATFYITGVQLEKGSTATSFDYRPYGTELGLCQRYYYRIFPANTSKLMLSAGSFFTSSAASLSGNYPVSMRVAPSALEQSGTAGHYQVNQAGFGGAACTSVPTFGSASADTFFVTGTSTGAAFTAGYPVSMLTSSASGSNAYLGWSAEL